MCSFRVSLEQFAVSPLLERNHGDKKEGHLSASRLLSQSAIFSTISPPAFLRILKHVET